MFFIFSAPVLIRHLRQIKAVVFMHWCLMRAVLLLYDITICCRTLLGHTKLLWQCMSTLAKINHWHFFKRQYQFSQKLSKFMTKIKIIDTMHKYTTDSPNSFQAVVVHDRSNLLLKVFYENTWSLQLNSIYHN